LLDGWGSGKSGTPWPRTHRAKASSCEANADDAPPVPVDGGLPVDDGLRLHAAASRARAAVAMMAAAVRAGGGPARRGRRMTRVLSFIVPSSGAGPWWRLVTDALRDRLLSGSWAAPFEVARGAVAFLV
jgi:hypothetical protein